MTSIVEVYRRWPTKREPASSIWKGDPRRQLVGDIFKVREDLPALTGARGIAACAVVGYHYAVPGCGLGYVAVDGFFVLSGFVLAHVYRDGIEPRAFLRARAARTLPVHLATTLALGALGIAWGVTSWPVVAAALVGMSIVNPPAWSLIVEWYAYLLFPLVDRLSLLGVRGYLGRVVIIAATALFLASLVVDHGAVSPLRMAAGLGEFAAGVALYRSGARPRRVWLLDNRLALWLGAISYPLYLAHEIPITVMHHNGQVAAPATQAIGIGVSFILAVALHHLVEQPGRRWLRRSFPQRTEALS